MKRSRLVVVLVFFVIIILAVLQVGVSNSLSTSGIILNNLQAELKNYNKENSLVSEQVLKESSLTHIASSAGEIGFIELKSQLFLSTSLPLAVKQ